MDSCPEKPAVELELLPPFTLYKPAQRGKGLRTYLEQCACQAVYDSSLGTAPGIQPDNKHFVCELSFSWMAGATIICASKIVVFLSRETSLKTANPTPTPKD